MKTVIAIPTMGSIKIDTFSSFVQLISEDTSWTVTRNSVVYMAREELAQKAKNAGAEYIFWIDSDMKFPPDTLMKLMEDAEKGMDFVSGICFTKTTPPNPTILKRFEGETGIIYHDYPKDQVFEVAASGFGCCLMKTSLYEKGVFYPLPNWGEDYSFCIRMKEKGIKMYCDSRVKVGHVGDFDYNEELYQIARKNYDII